MFEISPEEITEGPLLRPLLVLAAPLLVQNLMQVLQQLVDLFWLGRLSGDAVAAVGLVFPLYALLVAFAVIAPYLGTQVLVSQRVGAEDISGARRALFTGMTVAAAIGVGLGVLTGVVTAPVTRLLTATQPETVGDTVAAMGAEYLTVIGLGLPFLALSDTVEGAFVGWGDSRAALYLNVLAVAINVVLDPILIFGLGPAPALGVEGAAFALMLGYTGSFLLGVGLIARGRNGDMLSRAAVTIDRADHRELLDVGIPTAAQQAARQTVRVIIISVVFAAGGPPGVAAYTVGARVAAVAFIPAHGLQQATQSVVGQNLGAGNPSRAGRVTWLGVAVATGALAVIALIQWLVPVPLVTGIAPDLGAEAFDLSVDYLRILAYGYPAIGMAYLLEGGFNGARRTRTSFMATLLQFWVVRLPIAALGGLWLGYGIMAVFWAVTLSNLLAAIGLGLYYAYSTRTGMLV
ncbi:MAG: MATE family efflux transporter, partial [Halobacteriales archaeon]